MESEAQTNKPILCICVLAERHSTLGLGWVIFFMIERIEPTCRCVWSWEKCLAARGRQNQKAQLPRRRTCRGAVIDYNGAARLRDDGMGGAWRREASWLRIDEAS